MFARHNRMISVLYVLADATLSLVSFGLAHALRSHLHGARLFTPAIYFLWIVPLIVAIWTGLGMVAGIYREIREEDLRRAFADPLKVAAIATTLLFALISALKVEYISRLLLTFYAAIDLAAMVFFR